MVFYLLQIWTKWACENFYSIWILEFKVVGNQDKEMLLSKTIRDKDQCIIPSANCM
jgi:hypothetical protein